MKTYCLPWVTKNQGTFFEKLAKLVRRNIEDLCCSFTCRSNQPLLPWTSMFWKKSNCNIIWHIRVFNFTRICKRSMFNHNNLQTSYQMWIHQWTTPRQKEQLRRQMVQELESQECFHPHISLPKPQYQTSIVAFLIKD